MIIDMHVHVFPDALAGRAKAALEQTSGIAACTTLTESDTRQLLLILVNCFSKNRKPLFILSKCFLR